MKLVTYAIEENSTLLVTFPIFIQDHNRQPLTVYEIETVKVPIKDENTKANSYTEIQISKPYISQKTDYYIQLRIQELRMCCYIRILPLSISVITWS